MAAKTKLLFVAAEADGFVDRLRVDREARAITRAIEREAGRDSIEIHFEFSARVSDLQAALRRHQPQILHFAGHAEAKMGIMLENDAGDEQSVHKSALGNLFALHGCVRMVVLNACESHALTDAFADVVDFMVGMKRAVHDEASLAFAEEFYGALAGGSSVDQAFATGVSRLELEAHEDANVPTLRVRRGVDRTLPFIDLRAAAGPGADGGAAGRVDPGGIQVNHDARVGIISNVIGNNNNTANINHRP